MTQEGFEQTVFVHKDKMYRFAKSLLGSEEDAYDTVQDVLMKLWQKRNDIDKYDNPEAFAMRCVKNDCLNRLKHKNVVSDYTAIARPEPVTISKNEDIKKIILTLISQLPEKQRMVMHLRDVEEYEIKEIGDLLEIEENAVRVNLMRARQKIKKQLENIFKYDQRQLGKYQE